MPVSGENYAFTKDNVDRVPLSHGVYSLHKTGVTIYIGRAVGEHVTLRSRLQSHQRGDGGPCTRAATQYRREVCSNPMAREKELLAAYKYANGRLPTCNDRVG